VTIDWATFGVDLHLEVNLARGRRAGLERALRDAIRAGRLAPHTRLPSSRALAAELGLARNTVAAAYDQLIAEGFLGARTGSGTVVAGQPQSAPTPRRPAGTPQRPRYDLRPGSPDVSTFPTAAWLRSTRRALASAPVATYDYGDTRGDLGLRTALAEYLGRTRGVVTSADRIVMTSGYVQALALLITALRSDGPAVVAMEDPGLSFHRDVARHAGARVVALPADQRGAQTDLLSTVDYSTVRAAVLTPAHQYPTGVTLHPQRRQSAVRWAQLHNGLVIEDDYDGEFRYDRQPVGALQGMAAERVAYIGTTSKTLGPALRLGWLVLPEWLVEPVRTAKLYADVHTETFGQIALADLITSHAYDRHIRAMRVRYRRRRDQLVERITPLAGRGITVQGIAAGLHALVGLPGPGSAADGVLARAATHGLALTALTEHWHRDGEHQAGLIVGYGTPGAHNYPAALDLLVRVLRSRG
jgi:GntR family transcriptional regulator/MocR family aminotransferase